MNASLPQLCAQCHKLKPAAICKRFKSGRYGQHYWLCEACLDKPVVLRQRRTNQESHPERRVRKMLDGTGHKATAEYPLGKFTYDFAVPSLRLLIEVDSRQFHTKASRRRLDGLKTREAQQAEWALVRVRASDTVGQDVLTAVLERKRALGK